VSQVTLTTHSLITRVTLITTIARSPTWSHQCAHFQARIFSVTTRDPLGGHDKNYPIHRLITRHKLVLRKLSQVRPTRQILPRSSRALLACGKISCGEHSQKDRGTRGQSFLLCFFLFSSGVFLTHPVSLLLSTLRVSWCTCHSLNLLFWLGGFPGAWMLFRGGAYSQSHGIDCAISWR